MGSDSWVSYLTFRGSNLESINTLLRVFGITFANSSYSGGISVGRENIRVESGAVIQTFPHSSYLFGAKLISDLKLVNEDIE